MEYRWGGYRLDREKALLTRHGQPIDVSRKVLDCISHLVEQRERVVSYDELIRKVWGHDNVTNHQLSQVVLAARRALGDDGQAQRLIRTMPGLGYRWVSSEIEDEQAAISASARSSEDISDVHAAQAPLLVPETSPTAPVLVATARAATRSYSKTLSFGLVLTLFAGVFHMLVKSGNAPLTEASVTPVDMVAGLNDALRAGRFEEVREGIATLPAHLADTPDARILEIELDFYRGRLASALAKLESQLSRPEAAADPILRARLLVLMSKTKARMGIAPSEGLALAQSTIAFLDSVGDGVPPDIRAQALRERASALMRNDRLDDALRDLALANDLFKRSGDVRRAIGVKSSIARVWMRMGRLQDALNETRDAAVAYNQAEDRLGEISALNTMTRIQMELLRWDDALASNDRSMRVLREVPDADRRYRTLHLRAQALTAKGQLRLAASQLEEAAGLRIESEGLIIPAFHLFESGNAAGALQAAKKGFDSDSDGDRADILLDSKDGALLLWISAAQKLADNGVAMPTPSPEQQQRLQSPKTALGRIASGRWLWSQGKREQAEAEFRHALDASRRMNHLFCMTLAAEPLVEMLLQNGDIEAAQAVATDLRAFDPERMDGDYRANLLRLRVALAVGDSTVIQISHRKTLALAGERKLPSEFVTRLSTLHRDSARRLSQN